MRENASRARSNHARFRQVEKSAYQTRIFHAFPRIVRFKAEQPPESPDSNSEAAVKQIPGNSSAHHMPGRVAGGTRMWPGAPGRQVYQARPNKRSIHARSKLFKNARLIRAFQVAARARALRPRDL